MSAAPRIIVMMGTSGAGKTTVGTLIAETLGWRFVDGDDLHPERNIRKMASGTPLEDADREPWLRRLRALIDQHLEANRRTVLTCSALKRAYRRQLGVPRERVGLVHLLGSEHLIARRLARRHGHFMDPGLLRSQIETLEPPGPPALTLEVSASPAALCSAVIRHFQLAP